ncbi:E3 ubiquitin-protein ligase CBL-B [Aphelenchoides avenae]|nr:E3 ubiquitin-protein ligase CBL-B [Aphelenchus avenae]
MSGPSCVTNPQDRRTIQRCFSGMETVIRCCQQSKLNLKNSPPFILDILPDTYHHLNLIFTNDSTVLQHNLYLQIFMTNMHSKCKQTIKLLKEEREKLMEEGSPARRSLSMKSLIFSHMLSELKAEFPEGRFIRDKFRITKKEAAEFWQASFGDKTIVPWEEFRNELSKVHRIGVGIETHALKNTVDLTCNNHISNFEFDVFTRLFQPWSTLLKNWQLLAVTHPGYVSFMTYEEVKQRLQQFINKPGTYVFRLSCTRLGQWAIGYVAPDGKIYQTIPQNRSLIQSLVDGGRDRLYVLLLKLFALNTIDSATSIRNGKSKNVDLSSMLQNVQEGRLKVTPEQYQIYCEMGTTFEMCKICDERNKNVKLEPCGHLLCRPCLNSWQESAEGGSTCPFCRCEIKGTEGIVIESYRPTSPLFTEPETLSATPSTSSAVPDLLSESPPRIHPPPVPPKRVASASPAPSAGQTSDTAPRNTPAVAASRNSDPNPTASPPGVPSRPAPPPPNSKSEDNFMVLDFDKME